jgi:ABC-2 type transport system permease protein
VLTFVMTAVPEATEMLSGSANINSPYVVGLLTMSMSVFAVFISTAFLSSALLRDRHFNTESLFLTRPIRRLDYICGRFLGGYAASLLVFSLVPLAIFVAALAPWQEAERLGPMRPLDYLHAIFVLGAPNLLISGALMFTVANLTRSTLLTYTGVIVFIAINSVGGALAEEPAFRAPVAILDPFGYYAFAEVTRYWSPAEMDTRLVPMSGLFLWNRLLWVAVAIGLLAFNVAAFSFDKRGFTLPWLNRLRRARPASVATPGPIQVRPAAPSFGAMASLRQFLLRTRHEISLLVRGVSIWVLMAVGVMMVLIALLNLGLLYGTPVYPVTRVVMNIAGAQFSLIPMIVLIFFAGELVWRDRVQRAHEMIDATATPSWVFVFSKVTAMWLVIAALSAVGMLTGMIAQAALGFGDDIDVGLYATQMLLVGPYNLYLIAMLSVFVQVLANNRYLGMLIMVGILIARVVLAEIGFSHNLYQFAAAPGAPYSDLNGYGHFLTPRAWFLFYWTLFAAILMVLAFALWNRGTLTPLWRRLAALPRRLRGPTGAVLAVLVLAFAGTGGFIFYNTNVLNTYRTQDDGQRRAVAYEKAYRKYEGAPQPRITGASLEVDIYPRARRYEARGVYRLVNRSDAPIAEVYASYGYDTDTDVLEQALDGAKLASSDEDHRFYIWRLDAPMQPGEAREFRFTVARAPQGFRNGGGNSTSVVWNGTFFNNFESMPSIGFSEQKMLQPPRLRRKFGLPELPRMPALEDEAAASRSYFGGNADWMDFEAVVSTSPDQIAIAPGRLMREWEKDGRRYFHYKMETPILNFYSFLSARYEVAETQRDGVLLQVFHHPGHDYNVPRMLETMGDSIDYFSKAFGPFQHSQMRIFEFPAFFGQFAQSFPNSVPVSEDAGFIADNSDPKRIDYVYYITAHEVAHQWWAHQVLGANTQGATLLSETFAQYSALMLMEKEYGEHHIRRFLKYELDQYLTGRSAETREELPLFRVENQMYIHYNKGSLVMYALQDYLGEDVVNRALARLIAEHGLKFDPYPRSTDFLRILREEAGPEHERLIDDLFEKIVLFDLKATELSVAKREDGRFDVSLTIEAKKFEADGDGKETPAQIDYMIDIGLFTQNPNEATEGAGHVLLLEKRPVTTGENVFKFTLDAAPEFGGIDPYNKLIDRISGDNLISIEGDTGETMMMEPAVPMQRS